MRALAERSVRGGETRRSNGTEGDCACLALPVYHVTHSAVCAGCREGDAGPPHRGGGAGAGGDAVVAIPAAQSPVYRAESAAADAGQPADRGDQCAVVFEVTLERRVKAHRASRISVSVENYC